MEINVLNLKGMILFLTFFLVLLLWSPEVIWAESGIEWVHRVGAGWLFFFIIGVAVIFLGIIFGKVNWKLRKYCSIAGLVIVILSTFGAQMVYLVPYLGDKVIEYSECKEVSFGEKISYENVVYTLACIFVGYAPSGTELTTLAIFIIFGIIAPIGILIALFYEFTAFFVNPGVRNVMAFLSALVAYRFLLATLFIDLLGYGFAGLGILIFNYFFFMVIFRLMKDLWSGAAMIENIIRETRMERMADLTKRLRDAEEMLSILDPNTKEYKQWEMKKKRLEEELKKLEGEIKSPRGIGS